MPLVDRVRAYSSAEKFITTQMTPADMLAIMVFEGRGVKDDARFTAADKARQLEEALSFEDPITDIPMAMEVNYFQLNRAEYFVPVSVRMPGASWRVRERPAPPAR